jgi:hypothetical protein
MPTMTTYFKGAPSYNAITTLAALWARTQEFCIVIDLRDEPQQGVESAPRGVMGSSCLGNLCDRILGGSRDTEKS